MKIDIPVRNEDGSVSATFTANEHQVQALLEFALNFMIMAGLTQHFGVAEHPVETND